MGRQGTRGRQVAATLAGIALAVSLAPAPAAQSNDLNVLMERVGDYISTFILRFSNVVAEESYKQEISSPRRKRQLKSDFLLAKYPGATGWVSFRDTFEVDGKSVRTEPERLTKLFLDPSDDAVRRAREITNASAKYNLARIGTLNFPLLVLSLLQTEYHGRFHFTLSGMEKSLGPDVRTIRFQEYRQPTLITRDGNGDLFTAGLIWVEQQTGRVVKTQLRVGARPFESEIVTTFTPDEALGISVPAEMREWYPDQNGEITGVATYGRFRRFQVTADETVK